MSVVAVAIVICHPESNPRMLGLGVGVGHNSDFTHSSHVEHDPIISLVLP